MKGLVFLVLACFFAGSQQQGYYWPHVFNYPHHFEPLYHHQPAFRFVHPAERFGYFNYPQSFDNGQELDVDEDSGIEGRRITGALNHNRNKVFNAAENRGFGSLGLLGYNYVSRYLPYTVTTTSFVVSTTSVTVGSVATCFASAIFKDPKLACRKRRDVILAMSSVLIDGNNREASDKVKEGISPSQVQPIIPTVGVDDSGSPPRVGRSVSQVAELRSSMPEDDVAAADVTRLNDAAAARYKRLNIQTKTVTSTTTTTVLVQSAVTSTISTAFAAAAAVLCVPSGWKVC